MSRMLPVSVRAFVRPAFVVSVAAIGLASATYAMRVSPMVVEMTTSGSGAVARVEVQNLNQVNLPFETRITRIDYDDKGNMTETPADGDFLVFPPQGLLPSGARQVVRLQWAGAPDMPASRGYYLSVNQLPIPLAPGQESTGAQVQVVYHMKALVTVAPPKATPKVEFVSAKPIEIEAKAPPAIEGAKPAPAPTAPAVKTPGLEIVVRNTGTRYAMMAGAVWTIEGKDTAGKPLKVVKSLEDLNRDIGVGYLAPLGGLRTFQVPTGTAFAPGSVKVRFGK
ncbi:Fimbrial chaperone protein [Sphingomonas sp. EC-HK361]|uniref:fimbria/pilus periplasmic chaperone n=1 Tax=Sphingomonas sp. EC-HK361 TaxID=2038397 RepID=UPI001250E97A|nr:fimbria/pilus periplasmic chaperone [Sphingomonas sp. EC-HK361]VVT22382.1 Fimbrial chaperone protein [Sphingomonas sp. EC-HK361]